MSTPIVGRRRLRFRLHQMCFLLYGTETRSPKEWWKQSSRQLGAPFPRCQDSTFSIRELMRALSTLMPSRDRRFNIGTPCDTGLVSRSTGPLVGALDCASLRAREVSTREIMRRPSAEVGTSGVADAADTGSATLCKTRRRSVSSRIFPLSQLNVWLSCGGPPSHHPSSLANPELISDGRKNAALPNALNAAVEMLCVSLLRFSCLEKCSAL